MAKHISGAWLASLAGMALCAFPAMVRATESDVSADDARLEAIGYRLATANADRCETPSMLTGLMLQDIGGFAPKERPAATRAYGLTFGFGVLHTVPGSPAEQAGILTGDEIVALNGGELEHFAEDAIRRNASYERTETFLNRLEAALQNSPATLTLRRGSLRITVPLVGKPGCGGRFVVVPDKSLNAWTDGTYVAVTGRMMRFAADDQELAFVVAHEMAHNILEHDKQPHAPRFLAELGFGAGSIKQAEIEADAYAIKLLARAGFDLAAPERFLRRSSGARWMDLPITHPGTNRRVEIVREAIAGTDPSPPLVATLH